MGMYDEIECEYPLPGNPPAWIKSGHRFQTKDLSCLMETYTIEADGTFSEPEYTGELGFYTSNVVGTGPGTYTKDGEDAESVAYRAVIVGGVLSSITETEHTREPAWPVARQINRHRRVEVAAKPEIVPVVGMRLYVLMGSLAEPKGYWGRVVAVGRRHICLESEGDGGYSRPGDLEVHYLSDVGRLITDDDRAAIAARRAERQAWDEERAAFVRYQQQAQAPEGPQEAA